MTVIVEQLFYGFETFGVIYMPTAPNKQSALKKITRGLTVGTVITGSTFFHGPPVLALGLTKLLKKSSKIAGNVPPFLVSAFVDMSISF